jgi:hypothetical protein
MAQEAVIHVTRLPALIMRLHPSNPVESARSLPHRASPKLLHLSVATYAYQRHPYLVLFSARLDSGPHVSSLAAFLQARLHR